MEFWFCRVKDPLYLGMIIQNKQWNFSGPRFLPVAYISHCCQDLKSDPCELKLDLLWTRGHFLYHFYEYHHDRSFQVYSRSM